jgi:hypothetical protein
MFYTIKSIKPNIKNYTVKIIYSDDVVIIADFKELVKKGVMRQLMSPMIFNQVKMGHKGRSIIWNNQAIDFCADSLRLKQ